MLYVRHVGNNGHPCKFSGTSGERQESARNLPFPGVIWMTAMPQLQTFPTSNMYSHFRPPSDLPGNFRMVLDAAEIVIRNVAVQRRPVRSAVCATMEKPCAIRCGVLGVRVCVTNGLNALLADYFGNMPCVFLYDKPFFATLAANACPYR